MSQLDSTIFLVKEIGLSLAEADSLIVNSPVWEINKDKIINFREGFANYLSDLTDSDLEELGMSR